MIIGGIKLELIKCPGFSQSELQLELNVSDRDGKVRVTVENEPAYFNPEAIRAAKVFMRDVCNYQVGSCCRKHLRGPQLLQNRHPGRTSPLGGLDALKTLLIKVRPTHFRACLCKPYRLASREVSGDFLLFLFFPQD